ncbi:MAG TPA: S8 family serine peptidase, partial [Patescibacteria group bacterium]|nr:S8 family serine peptidase [Patescibacteria group bacterium]
SVDLNNRLSNFANYGRCVDIAAPGERIYSTEHFLPEQGYNQEFGGAWQGTSFATPIVAGTAALLKALRPDWKAEQIIGNILQNTENIDSLNASLTGLLGYGKLNAGVAVKKAAEELATRKPALLVDRNGTLNYLKNNSLFAYNTATEDSMLLARVQDGKLTDWTDTASEGWALLIYRAPYYFIQLRDSAGDFTNEFPVGNVDVLKEKRANITKVERGIVEGEERLVVAENKKAATDVVVYNLQGEKVNRFVINKKLENWSVYGNYLATAHFENTNLVLRLYNLDGSFLKEKTVLKAYGLDDLEIGALWGGENPQIVALVRKSRDRSKLERMVVDILSGSTMTQVVKNPGIKTHWYLFLTDFDGDGREDYMSYRLIGGKYDFLTGKGQLLATWSLPKF